jgi:hypothetical protein
MVKANIIKEDIMVELCSKCHERPVYIKKRGLCRQCYQKMRRQDPETTKPLKMSDLRVKKIQHRAEIVFTRNYFTHKNWVYQPALFHFTESGNYAPDFYDQERNVFIEVAGTRQAYYKNRHKYTLFRETFPGLTLEIRTDDGELFNEESPDWKEHVEQLRSVK